MLKNLYINNIALIEKINVEFNDGLCVLSGETGAGKSIIVDSLSFVLGGRADKTLIKSGQDKAFVEAVFEVAENSPAVNALEQFGFDRETTIVLSRTMTSAGKNDCRINGRLCALSVLKSLSSCLADIFGQSEHIGILKTNTHMQIIDAFDRCPFLTDLENVCKDYKDNQNCLVQYGGSPEERERMLDLMSYEISEIETAALSLEEEAELIDFKNKVSNIEKIASSLKVSLSHLTSDTTVSSELWLSAMSINGIVGFDNEYNDIFNRLTSAKYEIDDLVATIEQKLQDCDYNPLQVDRVEERLTVYKRLKKKYGGTIEEVLSFLNQTKQKYNDLIDATAAIDKIHNQMLMQKKEAYSLSEKCSQYRMSVAQRFSKMVADELNDLGMKNAKFFVQFSEKPSIDNFVPSKNGYDNIEFMFSANLGEPLKPLAKVISGGEMSRFLLAIKNITAGIEDIPTMVFDEIDVGLSGHIAQMVAKKLAGISKNYQCIVVTHLPQVVAMGNQNYFISKYVEEGKTFTNLLVCDFDSKTKEVARLMGGENIGEYSLLHAKEMLLWADEYKKSIK